MPRKGGKKRGVWEADWGNHAADVVILKERKIMLWKSVVDAKNGGDEEAARLSKTLLRDENFKHEEANMSAAGFAANRIMVPKWA